jgi:hypothetical protein
MIQPFLKKLLIAISALLLLVYASIYACSDYDWDWSFDSNFTPESFVEKSYSPLFLSSEVFYGIGFDNEHTTRFNAENVKDWKTYLEDKINEKELTFFLTDSSSADVSDLMLFFKKEKPNKVSEKWNKKFNLSDPKVKSFIFFLNDAQAIEKYSTQTFNSWNYDENVNTEVLTDFNFLKSLEKKYNDTKDPFLKNRYWFQVIKANFYSVYKVNGGAFFYKTENLTPKNSLYYRALSYVAGIEYKRKEYAKSNFHYSQVFDKCPSLRVVSAYCFHPQEEKDWKQSLALAKTKEEKAALWAIQGYYNDEEKAIAEIYKIQPQNPHLDYLLTRLINNQENKIDRIFKDKTVLQNKKSTKDSISKTTLNLILKIAQSNITEKQYLWNSAAGYLETLNGNFKQADQYFEKAEKHTSNTPLAISQLRLLKLINNLSKIDVLTPENEKTITADLSWLYQELPKKAIENFRYSNATSWSKNYLAAVYRSQKNTLMSEIFNHDSSFYDNEIQLEAMKSFLNKPNKTEIEKLGSAVYEIKLADINYFQAVKATFQNNIAEAITFMKQTSGQEKTLLYGNPFLGAIKDCHDCDHQANQKKKYTMLEFLTYIQKMQDNVAKKIDVYTNCMLLGNAFYNITFFGNARLFYEGPIAGYGSDPSYYRDSIRNTITNSSLAKSYYEKAFLAAKNNEQKAKCNYMMAKCERNDYYNKKYYLLHLSTWDIQDDTTNFIAWEGFKNLKANYAKTKYYKEVINECGYFKTYVQK